MPQLCVVGKIIARGLLWFVFVFDASFLFPPPSAKRVYVSTKWASHQRSFSSSRTSTSACKRLLLSDWSVLLVAVAVGFTYFDADWLVVFSTWNKNNKTVENAKISYVYVTTTGPHQLFFCVLCTHIFKSCFPGVFRVPIFLFNKKNQPVKINYFFYLSNFKNLISHYHVGF